MKNHLFCKDCMYFKYGISWKNNRCEHPKNQRPDLVFGNTTQINNPHYMRELTDNIIYDGFFSRAACNKEGKGFKAKA